MRPEGSRRDGDTVSVVMAVRDGAPFLAETLASLRAQTRARFEFVAVDDGSADDTGAMLGQYAADAAPERPVHVSRTNGVGLAAARNLAIEAASGALILLLDGDDLLAPDLIEKAANAMASSDADVVYPLFDHIDENGEPLGIRSQVPKAPLTPARLLRANPVHSDSGVMVRAEAARAVGGFDPSLTGCVGLDFWCRVAALRPQNMVCLAAPLVRYRRRPGQITADPARMEANFAEVVAKAVSAGLVTEGQRTLATAMQSLYWASLADARGDYARARRYTASSWRRAPLGLALQPYAYFRGAVSAASLLPAPVHLKMRRVAHAIVSKRL